MQDTAAKNADDQYAKGESSRLVRGIRFVLIALILLVGCNLAYGFGKWLARWRQVREPLVAGQLDSPELGPAAISLPLAGPWSFDSLDWKMRSQLLEGKEVDALFASLGAIPPFSDESQLPETDSAIVDLLTALQVRPTEQAGNQVFRVDRPDFKAQLVTRKVDTRTRTVAFVIAYRQNGEKWQLYEFNPGSAASKEHAPAPHLLPLPVSARRDSGRFSEDGQLLLEFISLDSTGKQLLSMWKESGWEVHANKLADPADFSCLCRRGDEVIYAWSADPHDALRNLMLVRTPNVEDTEKRRQPPALPGV